MSIAAEESVSNIRTVKAFAEERGHAKRFEKANWDVFEHGRGKAYFWAVYFFTSSAIG